MRRQREGWEQLCALGVQRGSAPPGALCLCAASSAVLGVGLAAGVLWLRSSGVWQLNSPVNVGEHIKQFLYSSGSEVLYKRSRLVWKTLYLCILYV